MPHHPDQLPAAGGSYTRDPDTGALTPTPSAPPAPPTPVEEPSA